jgi:molybdopterin-guanine dinucleotide biosynthesis protein A
MAERVARTLESAGCAPVVLVGGDATALAALGRTLVPDEWPGEGPLGGVITALHDSPADGVVVAACDLPWLAADDVRALLGESVVAPPVEVVAAASDRLQPALAWWSPRGLPTLQRCWGDGMRALHDAVAELPSRTIAVDAGSLRNVNRPSDLPGPSK